MYLHRETFMYFHRETLMYLHITYCDSFLSQNFLWMIGVNELISLSCKCHTFCVFRFAGTQSISATSTIPETMDHLALPLGFILSFSILIALAPCMYLFCRTVPIFWLSFTQTCLVFFICLLSFSVLCHSNFHLPRTNCIKKKTCRFVLLNFLYLQRMHEDRNYVKHYSIVSIKLLLWNKQAGILY